jgi:hypothetical protein
VGVVKRVRLVKDEWWPVYKVTDGHCDVEVDLPEALIERLDSTLRAFAAVQDEVDQIVLGLTP